MKSTGLEKVGRVDGLMISRLSPPTIALTSISLPATDSIGKARTAFAPGLKAKKLMVSFALEITASRECKISIGVPLEPDVWNERGLEGFVNQFISATAIPSVQLGLSFKASKSEDPE